MATIHVTDDGYLLGFSRDRQARLSWRYWHPAGSEDCIPDCDTRTVVVRNIPERLEALEAIGTSDQTHSDGYEAYEEFRRLEVR